MTYLVAAILAVEIIRLLMGIRDTRRIDRMNKRAETRQQQWQDDIRDYRKRELDELIDMARTAGEVGKMADELKAVLRDAKEAT